MCIFPLYLLHFNPTERENEKFEQSFVYSLTTNNSKEINISSRFCNNSEVFAAESQKKS